MAENPRPAMSEAELEVLKALWSLGSGTVREIHEALTTDGLNWTRSTVITLLQRLEKKGYVTSDKSAFAFVFRPLLTREDVMHQRISELAHELAEGDAVPVVLAFAERHPFTEAEIKRLRELIDQMDAKRRRRGTR
jgi:predicted transcriptional regulator